MSTSYHNPTFDNISQAKRDKVLAVAAAALASEGLASARMKDIAKAAGVSYGSLYNYFPTRDAMIRCIILEGKALQEALLANIAASAASFFDDLANMIEQVQAMSIAHKSLIAIWLELSQSCHARFVDDIVELENAGIVFWKARLAKAIEKGEVTPAIGIAAAAHIIDSLISSLLATHVSPIQAQRIDALYPDLVGHEHRDTAIRTQLIDTLTLMLARR